ncbi:pantoate--beta-alanine ligase [Daejeonella rubra]|uniref:Pantothenate synthetase n=1 Tax=Daejeonella rubra TaxID=990371 RepID=A0A1G9R2Y7_9SPHI|nr:pantoate--beta-alanine ligase [Daejeonella rubra]SDM17491.1 pantoate--beta-alanine ligase [Daejeonella rubra]
MKIFNSRQAVHNYLNELRASGNSIGFVPTMGALHAGHLSLIKLARQKSDVIVCSIFVNPTQFNDKKDLENYPRPVEDDIRKLEEVKCDVLFIPGVAEMYNSTEKWNIELGNLDKILEGKIRPGHYQGVTQIVKKLFDTINPHYAFFGQKDYQQFMVISYMVKKLRVKIKLVLCPIIRESDGLAMSSRNIYLSPPDRKNALALYKALSKVVELYKTKTIAQIIKEVNSFLKSAPGIELEYFEIFNAKSFEAVTSKRSASLIALVAAKVGSIRIIDNMILK